MDNELGWGAICFSQTSPHLVERRIVIRRKHAMRVEDRPCVVAAISKSHTQRGMETSSTWPHGEISRVSLVKYFFQWTHAIMKDNIQSEVHR